MTKRIITILILALSLSLFVSAAEITSANDMLTLMNTPSMWADSYTLTTDIDLSDATNGLSQMPIGTAETQFTGSFDGAGHEISNINITGDELVALFGYIKGATITELTISGTVTATGDYSGGLVAYASGEMYISKCHNKCNVTSAKQYVGGICGYATGSDKSDTVPKMNITECMNSGTITSLDPTQSDAGGIAGSIYAVGNVSDCFNEGLVTTGDVSLDKPYIAGIVGKTGSYGRVTNCYNITAPQTPSTETTYVRAIVGRPNVKNGSNNFFKDGLGMSDKNYGSAYTTADFAALNEHGLWVNATEPRLAYFATEISSADDMLTFMNTPSMWAGSYTLTTDIDLGDATNGLSQTPIGNTVTPFTGSFDGAGYEISGINLVGETCVALFGYTNGGTIKNLTISGTVSSSGEYTGGFVAYAKDEVYISRCHNKCDIIGLQYMGGICGYATGSDKSDTVPKMNITECMNSGTITSLDPTQSDAGGIAGSIYAVGNVSDCFNEGLISTGDVSLSKPYIGGIVGKTGSYGRVTNCYNITAPQTPSSDTTYTRAIVGRPNVKNGANNFFKDGLGMSDKNYGSAYTTANFAALNEHGLWINATEPRLAYFATEISSADDMLTLMNTPSMWADNYKLTADIDLSKATNGLSQAPIGTETNPFTGNFDGQGYTVSGINISGVADVGLFGYIGGGGTVMIKNLTVSGTVSGTGDNVGGIIGRVYKTSITIENCTNFCTVNGGVEYAGGIVGRLTIGEGTVLISECKNEGAITTGKSYAAGIAGFSTNTSGSTIIEKCLNTGTVTTTNGGSAGIVGYWRAYSEAAAKSTVRDCMNIGRIISGTSGYAGGIIARGESENTAYTVTRCFNTGSVTAAEASYVRPLVGRPAANAVISDCYYTTTDTYTADSTNGAEIFVADATVAANVSGLGDAFVLVDGYAPELKAFHTHEYAYISAGSQEHNYICYCGDVALTEAHNFVDGVCDKCGASAYCAHENGEWREISAASCVDLAKYVWYCADCNAIIEDITKNGESLDSGNHVTDNYIWNFDGEKYYFACTACESKVEQTEAPTVYVSANGNDKNDGMASATAVATLTEAVSRIANVGGTVVICGSFPLSDTELPTYTKPITFMGDEGYYCGGFKLSQKTVLSLGGETVFDNILFDGGSDKCIIECNWNNVTFGKVEVINDARIYIILGTYNITESDDTKKEATVTITEGATLAYNVKGKISSEWFYSRIYLGDIFGADGISVANKTATLNAENADISVIYTMSTSSNYRDNPVINCETTVNLYGKTVVDKGRTGDYNVNYADSTASLTKQTINFFDNSSIRTNYYIRNAENTVLHVSDGEEGRTQPMNLGFTFYSYGTFATSAKPMNVDFSYGTHSFAPALTNPIVFSAVADAQKVVTEQKNDECVYTSKVTVAAAPDANGTKLYSCTCGRTYTEEYVYSCEDAAHLYIANADGTFTCSVCDETFATVRGENVFAVSSATVENGKVTVTATVNGSFAAAQFNVLVPTGFAFAKATLPTVEGFVFASGEIDGAHAVTILSENAKEKAINAEIVLEYTLAEGATDKDALIEVTVPELYTDDGEKAVATTVCAVWAKSECLHEITKEIVTLVPTCTNTGSKNIVCAECGALVEANAVIEKDSANHGNYGYVCSDGKVVCCGCKTEVDSIDSPVVLTAASKSSESREVSVTVSIKAVAPILASRFVIDAPDGFTLVSAESLVGTADENTSGFTLILLDSTLLPYEAIVMNLSLEDATVDAAVLKLTFAVADNVSEGNYIISVNALETYDISGTAIDTTSVPCEVSVSARKAGDIDGDGTVTVLDALMLIRAIVNDETIVNGDVNGDGKVGLADAIRIMKLITQ